MKRFMWLIILSILWFIVSLSPVSGQANTIWSRSELLGEGWWQSMDLDRAGRLHVAWYGSRNNTDALIYTSRSPDGQWSVPNDVFYNADNVGNTVRSALAVTSDGVLNAVYRIGVYHQFSNAYSTQAGIAGSWRLPIALNTQAYYIDLVADHNDVLHTVYGNFVFPANGNAEFDPCYGCSDLFYRRSTDGGVTWSIPVNLTDTPETGIQRPDIFEGESGRLYIIWDEGFDPAAFKGTLLDVRIVYSEDGGVHWSEPITLNGGDGMNRVPSQLALTELRDGGLLAVWRTDDLHIYYQLSQDLGVTWTDPQPIPGISPMGEFESRFDDYELVTDHLGTAHLFAAGHSPDSPREAASALYHIEYNQGNWRRVERIFYDPGLQVNWPKAVIGVENDIHLTWFTSTAGKGYGDLGVELRVYYSHRMGVLANQPALAFNPTRMPLPTATPFQRLEPTLTPFPTTQPIVNPASMTTGDNQAAQTFLGGLFATGILCLGVIVFYRLILRR